MKEIFRENSKELEAVNYFRQKNSIIHVWEGSNYT